MSLVRVATALILDDKKRVLFGVRRTDKRFPWHSETPGGKLEAGESFEGALRRELLEELGVDSTNEDFVGRRVIALEDTLEVRMYRVILHGIPQALDHYELLYRHPRDLLGRAPCTPAFYALYKPMAEYIKRLT